MRSRQGLDEVGPLLAIFNVREARGDDAVRQLSDAYRIAYNTDVIHFTWKEEGVPIPLGWFISNPACASLDEQFEAETDSINAVGAALKPSR